MARRAKEPAPDGENVRPVDPLLDAPAEVHALPEPPREVPAQVRTGPTFGQSVSRFFRFLLRVIVSVFILSLFVLALYFGLPLLNERYVAPVEQNISDVAELQSRQEQTEQQMTDLQTRLETIESVQNQHDDSLTALDQRLIGIETEIAARTQSLAALEELQSELQAQSEASSAEMERQIGLMKSMELLSRARLFMYQSNFGLAQQDVQIARDLLATIRPDAPKPLAAELDAVLLRLDMTLSNLPDFPVAASDDLDIAWQILLSGLPATPTAPAQTATPAVTSQATSTPTFPATVVPTSIP